MDEHLKACQAAHEERVQQRHAGANSPDARAPPFAAFDEYDPLPTHCPTAGASARPPCERPDTHEPLQRAASAAARSCAAVPTAPAHPCQAAPGAPGAARAVRVRCRAVRQHGINSGFGSTPAATFRCVDDAPERLASPSQSCRGVARRRCWREAAEPAGRRGRARARAAAARRSRSLAAPGAVVRGLARRARARRWAGATNRRDRSAREARWRVRCGRPVSPADDEPDACGHHHQRLRGGGFDGGFERKAHVLAREPAQPLAIAQRLWCAARAPAKPRELAPLTVTPGAAAPAPGHYRPSTARSLLTPRHTDKRSSRAAAAMKSRARRPLVPFTRL